MITIVSYGLGNVQALANIYKRLNIPTRLATNPDELRSAERLILPGVGAFDWAMESLNASGMHETLDELVLRRRRPVLGICVGMQMLCHGSDEGVLPGLGWIDADVKRFDEARLRPGTQLPHMGWNDVSPRQDDPLFRNLQSGAQFYFLHSYFVAPRRPSDELAITDFGGPFAAAVHSANIWGVQFHPEKSHHWGVQLLKNFAEV